MATIKEDIISKIQTSKNEQLLEEVYRILEADEYVFSEQEVQLLKEADDSICDGQYSTQEQVESRMKEWLNNIK